MHNLKQTIIFLLSIVPLFVFSQDQIPKTEKATVIKNVKEIIESKYVFADKVEHVINSIDQLVLTGKYDEILDFKEFGKILSADLIEITSDKHFLINYNPELVKSRRAWREGINEAQEEEEEEEEEEEIDWNLWYAKKENFGFEKIEILGGNIGYIKSTFWQPLDWVRPTIDATMKFVSHTDALIIDLTENQGGYSPTDSYLGSYFFEEEPTLWISSYNRPTNETDSLYTFQEIGGERYLNKPLYILVSENSFSLAEQFSYCMKHFGKATIIGQTSAGAAHAIDFLEVSDNFLIQIPTSYSIHPKTKTDWEGTGVRPNIKTSKEETLKVAHLTALNGLIENAQKMNYKTLLKRYDRIKAELNKG